MSSPTFTYGQVPTPAQWTSYFAGKQDALGYTAVNRAGDTMTGKLVTTASIAGTSGFSIPPGVAPTIPSNGDIWTTNAGVFAQINGTATLLGTGGVVTNGTAGQIAYYSANGGIVAGNTNLKIFNGALTAGSIGGAVAGSIILAGLASGGVTLASAAAGGSGTITFPAGTIDFSATGGAGQVIVQGTAGGIFTVRQLTAADFNATTTGTGSLVLNGAPTFSSTINIVTGIQINGSATSGNVLRGNGTNFISAQLGATDLSNGVTGTGAVVLASAPTFTSTIKLNNGTVGSAIVQAGTGVTAATLTIPNVTNTILTTGSTGGTIPANTVALGTDVSIGTGGAYADGPGISLGSLGTWFVTSPCTFTDLINGSAGSLIVKLWDGTTIIASASVVTSGAGNSYCITLAGAITAPAGNVRMSATHTTSPNIKFSFNKSGNSKDCTITAIRIN